jgi:hypothetical protein
VSSVTSTAQMPLKHGMTALRADHIPQAVSLSAALGWPYREEDWQGASQPVARFRLAGHPGLLRKAVVPADCRSLLPLSGFRPMIVDAPCPHR